MLYVGKAKNLRKRVNSYFQNKDLGEKTSALISRIVKVRVITTDSEIESLLLEANLIKKYLPKYNVKLTDDKRYPSIRITVKDQYPSVLLARKQDDPKSLYFGPFPNAGDVKLVLKRIRRVFPFQSTPRHTNRICLYYHLGLCLCPIIVEKENRQKEYKRNIVHLIQFLEGKTNRVLKDLEKERDAASKIETYEQASKIQKQITAIQLITKPSNKPFAYEVNPNLLEDLRQRELITLLKTLQDNGVAVKTLTRIECYDISNISGTNAVGSMVVFINGEKDGDEYRRFKIRFTPTDKPNDFAMMQEVIRRRLKHFDDWGIPDLFIVDGGKGQISYAHDVLLQNNCKIPLVGLAKREETIITSDFKEIHLPKDNPGLHVIQRIRDEAHRFAITYHRKLRARMFIGK